MSEAVYEIPADPQKAKRTIGRRLEGSLYGFLEDGTTGIGEISALADEGIPTAKANLKGIQKGILERTRMLLDTTKEAMSHFDLSKTDHTQFYFKQVKIGEITKQVGVVFDGQSLYLGEPEGACDTKAVGSILKDPKKALSVGVPQEGRKWSGYAGEVSSESKDGKGGVYIDVKGHVDPRNTLPPAEGHHKTVLHLSSAHNPLDYTFRMAQRWLENNPYGTGLLLQKKPQNSR